MKKKINKKTIVFASLSGVIALICGTFAVNMDWTNFANPFSLDSNVIEYIETFDSPDNWLPCDETEKLVVATNRSDQNQSIRLSYEEYWKIQNSTSEGHTTDLPLEKDGSRVAIINFQNENDWTLRDGWYYYKNEIAPGESTSSLFKSVQLNCNLNFGGRNECTNNATGSVCAGSNNEYESATYHIYITIQAIQAEASEHEWGDFDLLYDTIADSSLGLDSSFNPNYGQANALSDGAYTLSSHANDANPVYFYYGSEPSNHLIYGGYCWVILRTTESGGTRLLYDGVPTDGKCRSSEQKRLSQPESLSIATTKYSDSSSDTSMASSGYMHDTLLESTTFLMALRDVQGRYNYKTEGVIFANDVSWNGSSYTLTGNNYALPADTTTYTDGWNTTTQAKVADEGYHYTCANQSTTCSSVYYLIDSGSGRGANNSAQLIKLTNGATLESYKNTITTNSIDSNAKAQVENWFAARLAKANYEKEIEDSVYCNDRSFYGLMQSKDSTDTIAASKGITYRRMSYFGAYYRLNSGSSPEPSIDCANAVDRFTVSNTHGNGKLAYPVALATADEIVLSGIANTVPYVISNNTSAVLGAWTMTPLNVGFSGKPSKVYTSKNSLTDGSTNDTRYIIRPVISLSHMAYVEKGNGTANEPYEVFWKSNY